MQTKYGERPGLTVDGDRIACKCGDVDMPREHNFPVRDVRYWGNPTAALVSHSPRRCYVFRAALKRAEGERRPEGARATEAGKDGAL